MARTTRADVEGIIEVDPNIVPDDAAMAPFIEVANELVTERCTGSTHGPATAYSATRLELIERWLAAHFYAQRDPRYVSEKAGSVGATYQSKVDLGFDNTHYGQSAMRLDTNGALAALNEAIKDGVASVGAAWMGCNDGTQPIIIEATGATVVGGADDIATH